MVGNPLFANGRRYDPENGSYRLGGLCIDPLAGRFTSRAPLGHLHYPDEDGIALNP